MLDFDYLDRLEHFMDSGDMAFEFKHGEDSRRGEILDFLERLMDLAEKADQWATKFIFPNAVTTPGEGDGEAGGEGEGETAQ